jgi:hypothetical protein
LWLVRRAAKIALIASTVALIAVIAQLTMDQLALIRRAARLRDRRRAALDDADAELRRPIREGFEQGISGEKLAQAAGLA